MKPAARVSEAITLLEQLEAQGRPADALFQAHVRSKRYIGSKDRRAIGDLFFGVIRHHARLSWHVGQAGIPITPRCQVIAFLHFQDDQEVEALFSDIGPHAPDPLTEAEMALLDRLADTPLEPPEMPAATRLECPDWAEADLRQTLGDGFDGELTALLGQAALDIRAFRLRSGREAALSRLTADGFNAAPTIHSPDGIRLQGSTSLINHPVIKDGRAEIQDEGSQIAALMCDVSPGMQVVDFCSGAGGKALALGDLMQGKGRIVACDVSPDRLARGKKRFARAGLDNIEPRQLRDERDAWVSRQKGKFDRVLIDSPCSGSGAWRRNPWARWRAPDLDALTDLQSRILHSAARLVRPGGRLVYVTCSLLHRENQARVEAFLSENPNFRPISAADSPQVGELTLTDGSLLLTPGRHGTDGFFIAVLQREAE